ncbi:MAG: sodium:solute symporter [Verrucomicrobiota bacterium]|nr:sodium:solute symporter [Verrucomicrobiota bacterium]
MEILRWLDLLVIAIYMAAMALMGLRFARRQTSTERYFVAQRSIPGWAMGISLYATLISSVTFIAYPGAAYAGNWSGLVPGFMVIPVLVIAVGVLIPFYRRVVGMSAYEYFGKRFGDGARAFGAVAFACGYLSKLAFVFYLVALTVNSMTGWNIYGVTVAMGVVTVFYTFCGGLEAVIWTDVVQGFVKCFGVVICLAFLLFLPPGGPAAAFKAAWSAGKFNLGSLDLDFTQKGVWVMTLYGLFWFLQQYTADQTVVQRYLVTPSDRQVIKGTLLGGLLCVPVWTLFMLIGTLLWSFYHLTGEKFPGYIAKSDQIFPYFLSTHIPAGLAGLFMASLFAAAMSTISSALNCLAVIGTEDLYRRFRPAAGDALRLHLGKGIVVGVGLLTTAIAMVLDRYAGHALSLYFTATAIFSGGLFGLFFLAFFSTRTNTRGVWAGILACILFTAYATLTEGTSPLLDLGRFNFKLPGVMIGVIGNLVLIGVGYGASRCLGPGWAGARELTWWDWRERQRALKKNTTAEQLSAAPVGRP